jgi:hypothetical protein
MLAPGSPGYVPYCPFTLRPLAASAASPPDFDRARRLIARAGAAGARVAVHVPSDVTEAKAIGRWYVRTLRRLGFRARLRSRERFAGRYLEQTTRRGHRAQIGWSNWYAEAPLASFTLRPLFSCRLPAPGFAVNHAQFCDPRAEATMTRAHRLQATEPSAAAPQWAEVDHRVVRSAAVIPLFNTSAAALTSSRLRDFQVHPRFGPLLAHASVR